VGPLDTLEQRELISLGTLVLPERLSGAERGVFVLREAFDLSYDEIAPILGLTSANCRQLHTRAQKRLAQRGRFMPSGEEHRRLLTGFLTAAQQGDLATLQSLLATDVISYSDGGGRVSAARKPIRGRDRVSRFWLGLARKFPDAFASARLTELNGQPGLLLCLDRGAYTIAIEGQQGQSDGARIGALYAVINPDKLGYLERQLGWRPPPAGCN
jgi:RNA polymerase sigma-70 factor, ECF subfamily